MKKKIFSALFLSVFAFAFSQHEDPNSFSTFSLINSLKDQKWAVGYFHKINDRFWLGTEIGYGSKAIVPPVSVMDDYQSFEVRPSIFYSLAPDSRLKHFVGSDFFYSKSTGKIINSSFYDDNEYYRADYAEVDKKKMGAYLTYSILLHKESSRIAFLPKIGFGLRNLNIQYKNVKNLKYLPEPYTPTDGYPYLSDPPREGTRFSLYLDMKLVYKF